MEVASSRYAVTRRIYSAHGLHVVVVVLCSQTVEMVSSITGGIYNSGCEETLLHACMGPLLSDIPTVQTAAQLPDR